ncbi:transmembrane protein 170B [Trichomycterus rosablanca]|uniref:transmembrane protein 170B n=1 Tax=Trichomycterus rosablanca TaxID=2290929 RepID=UPI002F3558CA
MHELRCCSQHGPQAAAGTPRYEETEQRCFFATGHHPDPFSHLMKRGTNPIGIGGGGTMNRDYSINLSVQGVLSLWVKGNVPTLQHFTEMWYWVFLWCLFSSLFVHSAVGLLMCVMLQRHKRGRLITLVLISTSFLATLIGGVINSALVAWVYRVAGKGMAPLEALVFGVGQTTLTILISLSRILATL